MTQVINKLNNRAIVIGQLLTSGRNEYFEYRGHINPKHENSSGRVRVERLDGDGLKQIGVTEELFFPHVFNLQIVSDDWTPETIEVTSFYDQTKTVTKVEFIDIWTDSINLANLIESIDDITEIEAIKHQVSMLASRKFDALRTRQGGK